MKFQTFPESFELPIGSAWNKPQKVKFGIDPTFPRLHLGHLVPLRLVKQMMQSGHEVWIVLGTFTAQLGDPSGRDTTRPILSPEECKQNAALILKQLEKIIGESRIDHWGHGEVLTWGLFQNHTIHEEMQLSKFMNIASKFSLAHMTSRNAFQDRMQNNQHIGMHELLVPMLQGWDSVVLEADIEIGGQDQLFNFQIARQLQEFQGQKPQNCVLMPIINGTDGRKMSKSLGNCIFWDENPKDMFGKVMSIPDAVMEEWFPLFVDEETEETHPMKKKKILASAIVKQLHSEKDAIEAASNFSHTIQNKELPTDIPLVDAKTLLEAIVKMNQSSKTVAKQLLREGAVKINGEKIFDENVELHSGQIIQSGKRIFAKVE